MTKYTPMMPCPNCNGQGAYETITYRGFFEHDCEDCDCTGEVEASRCDKCDCRTDLYAGGDCPACDVATFITDNSPEVHKENYEALETLICVAITDILASRDWSRPIDPKIHLNGGDPFRDFKKVA